MTSLAQAQDKINKIMTAIDDVLTGKSVTFNGRSVTRENLDVLHNALDFWERRAAKAGGSSAIKRVNLRGRA